MDAFNVANQKIKELTEKLNELNWGKKSAKVALEEVERQAENQRKQLHQIEDQLSTAKEQILSLKKKLIEAEKARDQAEQEGYEVGGN